MSVVVVLLALGIWKPYAIVGFALGAMVAAGIFQEWARGAHSVARSRNENHVLALIHLIWANRPRYGGYVVHLAVVMVALGVVGTGFFNVQRDVVLSPGESVAVRDYEVRYVGTSEQFKGNRTEYLSQVEVYQDGEFKYLLEPKRAFYPSFNMASTQAAIRSTPVEDLYIVPSENLEDGSVGLRILVNPLIWWMWVAGPVMVLGTLIALWPQTSRVPVRIASTLPAVNVRPQTAGPGAD